jgi:hypothetical protein
VLFNACVPALWDQQVQAVRAQLAADTGLGQRALRRHVRVSFGKELSSGGNMLCHEMHFMASIHATGGRHDRHQRSTMGLT